MMRHVCAMRKMKIYLQPQNNKRVQRSLSFGVLKTFVYEDQIFVTNLSLK